MMASPTQTSLPGLAILPSSPTARRQKAGRQAPLPLAINNADTDLETPPATAESSSTLDSNKAMSSPPFTPTRGSGNDAHTSSSSRRFRPPHAAGKSPSPNLNDGSMWSPLLPSSSSSTRLQIRREAASVGARALSGTESRVGRRPSLGYNLDRRASSAASQHQSHYTTSPQVASAAAAAGQDAMAFLLQIVPPNHLPHDPPHPRSNPMAPGYGPPAHFKRGTLVPLYPTLSSQLAAIARAYGLPSTGGIVLYLVETTDPWASSGPLPGAAGFVGGPRIGEEAWNVLWRRLFEEKEEYGFDAEPPSEEDDDGFAPPVPPIPRSHQAFVSEGTASGQSASSPSFAEQQQQRRLQTRRAGLDSDRIGETEVEPNSASSDAASAGVDDQDATGGESTAEGSRSAAQYASRSNIGRGMPSSLSSPGAASSRHPSSVSGRLSSFSSRHNRHASRQSMRSTTSRVPTSGRATSFSNYSTASRSSAFGAAVVVGKVEFDIDRRRGKWYDAWLDTANESAASTNGISGASSAVQSPALASNAFEPMPAPEATPLARAVPLQQAAPEELPLLQANAQTHPAQLGADQSRGLRPLELSRSASPVGSIIERPEGVTSPGSSTSMAPSGYSNAAMAGHGSDEAEEGRRAASPAQSSSSRLSSVASSTRTDGFDDMNAYEPLADEPDFNQAHTESRDASTPFEEDTVVLAKSNAASTSGDSEYGERGEDLDDISENAPADRSQSGDPLADVFPDDERTWQSLAGESKPLDEREMVETTGLGISGASALHRSAAPGVLEETTIAPEIDDPLPPQDDVADVMDMLKSGQSEDRNDKVNLASPIHLDSSPSAPSNTGVFESMQQQQQQQQQSNEADDEEDAGQVPTARDTLDRSSEVPAAQPGHGSFGSFSSVRSLNPLSIDVRPPSTVTSSPEYIPERKQRDGWAAIPPVVDKSMSTSTSLASMTSYGEGDSQRSSTLGLMENLDDLERALADLSPAGTSRKSPVISEEAPLSEDSPVAFQPLPPAHVSEASSSSREVESEASLPVESPSLVNSGAPQPSPGLNSRPTFRYGSSPSSPMLSAAPAPSLPPIQQSTMPAVPPAPVRNESLSAATPGHAQASTDQEQARLSPTAADGGGYTALHDEPTDQSADEPSSSLDVERAPPRTSSLSRTSPRLAPHQLPLPPSPMPVQSEQVWQDAPAPVLSAPSSSALPPSPPRHPSSAASRAPAPVPPPIPATEEDQSGSYLQSRSPKSPGGFMSLRGNKNWLKGKDKEIDIAKAGAPLDQISSPTEPEVQPKSPMTTFFAKPAFAKLGGMFQKKSGADVMPEPSPVSEKPSRSMEDLPASESSTVPNEAPLAAEAAPAAFEPIHPPQRSASLDPTAAYGGAEVEGIDSDRPQQQRSTNLLPRPDLLPAPSSGSLRPIPSSESFQTAYSSVPPPDDPPASVTPTEQSFTPSVGAFQLPPLPSDGDFSISSPRSEYQPQTPVQGVNYGGYTASAPTTPAAWAKHLEPGSRFGRMAPGGSSSGGRPKYRISADIDQLLSQMNEIDFGGDEEDEREEIATGSEAVDAPTRLEEEPSGLSQPVNDIDPPHTPRAAGVEEPDEVERERKAYPKSLDLSRLGGLMTMSPSPPMSPERIEEPRLA